MIVEFLCWTFFLYWIHRLAHRSWIAKIHLCHHRYVNSQLSPMSWHWTNLVLFNDNWESTIDLWITEVLPTLMFSYVTGAWWISGFYYLWAALIQESIEHNINFNVFLLTSGKWHMIHHRENKNFGLFFPIWDLVFNTYKHVN